MNTGEVVSKFYNVKGDAGSYIKQVTGEDAAGLLANVATQEKKSKAAYGFKRRIITIDPCRDPRWLALLDRYPSSVFHSPAWLRVLANTYELDVAAHLVFDEAGQLCAGLPFCRHSDIKGNRIVILPFSDYCDPLVGKRAEWDALVARMLEEGCPISIRCLHNDVALDDEHFAVVNRAHWHGMDLTADLDTLWHKLPEAAQRAIKKATQRGVTLHAAQSQEELRQFYKLHLDVRKHKYHMLAQPYSFFENIWREFVECDAGQLLLASHAGELIGGTFFLTWRNSFYYKFNASDTSQLTLRPNDLLIWEGIQRAKARGCTHLDFGLSDWNQEGLIRFKRKFASEEKTIFFLRCGESTPTGQERQFMSLLPQLTSLLTQHNVPDDVTEQAGAVLYRFFM